MKTLAALMMLGTLGMTIACAGTDVTDDVVDETQEDLTARASCRGKSEGDTCTRCGGRPGCVETMEVKTCQKRGSRLYCRSGAPQPPAASYDPCAGKRSGDNCSICAPGDSNCFETMEVKTCGLSNGKLVCNAGSPAYNPCAGKRTGDSCNLCDPNDKSCGEIMVVKTCDALGICRPGQ